MIRALLKSGFQELGLDVDVEKTGQLETFIQELKKWNQKVNLTSITSDEDIVVKHLLDSLVVANHVQEQESILDIGSGAGFPAIPLKIVKPDAEVVSVDAVNKKILFQKHIGRLLKLNKFEALHARVEKMPTTHAGHFDVITSRAFSQLDQFVSLASPLLAEEGRMFAMKGPAAIDESSKIEGALLKKGFEIQEILPYFLPLNKGERNLIVIRRLKPR